MRHGMDWKRAAVLGQGRIGVWVSFPGICIPGYEAMLGHDQSGLFRVSRVTIARTIMMISSAILF